MEIVQEPAVDAVPTTPQKTPRGTSVKLSVPLDSKTTITTSRKLLRRDSMDRREALLKGKEGSRQRRRWENGKKTPPNQGLTHSHIG